MLNLLLWIVMTTIGIRSLIGLHRESTVISEFANPNPLKLALLLYPLGPLILHLGPILMPSVAAALLVTIQLALSLAVALKLCRQLERSGTNRTQAALAAANLAATGAVAGIIYLALHGVGWVILGYSG